MTDFFRMTGSGWAAPNVRSMISDLKEVRSAYRSILSHGTLRQASGEQASRKEVMKISARCERGDPIPSSA